MRKRKCYRFLTRIGYEQYRGLIQREFPVCEDGGASKVLHIRTIEDRNQLRTRLKGGGIYTTEIRKEPKAPLTPAFEALEDENDAVRAKATAIIEQRWAADQEGARSQKST